MPVSIGIAGQTGSRSAPTVINTAYGKTMFWDGRAPSLEGQAQGPIQNPIEMGKQNYKEIIERLAKIPAYTEQFEKVFGTPVTLDGMAKAIATFERVAALSGNSTYDKYNAGDNKALSDSEKRGMVLFGLTLNTDDEFKTDAVRQKAKCTLCHQGFNFTDEQFHNLGIGWDEKTGKFADLGRWAIDPIGAKNDADIGAFKTPTVREVAHTGALHARRQPGHARAGHGALRQGRNAQPVARPRHEAAQADRPGEGRRGRVHEGTERRDQKLDELLPTLPPGPDGKTPDARGTHAAPSKVAPRARTSVRAASSSLARPGRCTFEVRRTTWTPGGTAWPTVQRAARCRERCLPQVGSRRNPVRSTSADRVGVCSCAKTPLGSAVE